jgi:hypothetical protein
MFMPVKGPVMLGINTPLLDVGVPKVGKTDPMSVPLVVVPICLAPIQHKSQADLIYMQLTSGISRREVYIGN